MEHLNFFEVSKNIYYEPQYLQQTCCGIIHVLQIKEQWYFEYPSQGQMYLLESQKTQWSLLSHHIKSFDYLLHELLRLHKYELFLLGYNSHWGNDWTELLFMSSFSTFMSCSQYEGWSGQNIACLNHLGDFFFPNDFGECVCMWAYWGVAKGQGQWGLRTSVLELPNEPMECPYLKMFLN